MWRHLSIATEAGTRTHAHTQSVTHVSTKCFRSRSLARSLHICINKSIETLAKFHAPYNNNKYKYKCITVKCMRRLCFAYHIFAVERQQQ